MLNSLCKGCFSEIGIAETCPHCGFCLADYRGPALSIPPGVRLHDRYIVGKVLGSGGFGITYLAFDECLQVPVAIKEYLPKMMATRREGETTVMLHSEKEKKDYLHFMDSFLDEARLLARFNHESGIVSVLDFFQENETAYIVMMYVNGVTLEEYLTASGGRISSDRAVAILTPVMRSLSKVHDAGLIHRDISPDNLYITKDNQVRLLDFGAARYFVGQQRSTVSVLLKHGYAPPEQYGNKKNEQGPWTDVYALGATLYRMITGVAPEDAIDRIQGQPLPSVRSLASEVPQGAEAIIEKALSLNATERYRHVGEMLHAFAAIDPLKAVSLDIGDPAESIAAMRSRNEQEKDGTVLITGGMNTQWERPASHRRKRWLVGLVSLLGVLAIIVVMFVIDPMRLFGGPAAMFQAGAGGGVVSVGADEASSTAGAQTSLEKTVASSATSTPTPTPSLSPTSTPAVDANQPIEGMNAAMEKALRRIMAKPCLLYTSRRG